MIEYKLYQFDDFYKIVDGELGYISTAEELTDYLISNNICEAYDEPAHSEYTRIRFSSEEQFVKFLLKYQ